jgi:hypothetical protein
LFAEHTHAHGAWWQLEDHNPMHSPENALTRECNIGYPVPVLIMVYHAAASIENNTREGVGKPRQFLQPAAKSKPSVPRVDASSSSRDLAPAEPEEGGGESELPPVVSEEVPAKEEEDDGPTPIPDWSSFDLGRCLRALKSERTSIIVRALKRLHIRWYHCSSARMQALLQAAGVPKEALNLIPSVCSSCTSCRAWQKPSNRSMTSSRLSVAFGTVVQFDLLFIEDKIIAVNR